MPPKKKQRTTGGSKTTIGKRNSYLEDQPPSQSHSESSDELRNLASLIKSKQIGGLRHKSVEFEKKATRMLESMNANTHSKLNAHEAHLNKIYESVEQLNNDDGPSDDEVTFTKMLNKQFDAQINILSKIHNTLNEEAESERQKDQNIDDLLQEVKKRPQQLQVFSQKVTSECKREFKMHQKQHKLVSNANTFKQKYKSLINEAL